MLTRLAEKGYVVGGDCIAPSLAILIPRQQAEGGEAEADHGPGVNHHHLNVLNLDDHLVLATKLVFLNLSSMDGAFSFLRSPRPLSSQSTARKEALLVWVQIVLILVGQVGGEEEGHLLHRPGHPVHVLVDVELVHLHHRHGGEVRHWEGKGGGGGRHVSPSSVFESKSDLKLFLPCSFCNCDYHRLMSLAWLTSPLRSFPFINSSISQLHIHQPLLCKTDDTELKTICMDSCRQVCICYVCRVFYR